MRPRCRCAFIRQQPGSGGENESTDERVGGDGTGLGASLQSGSGSMPPGVDPKPFAKTMVAGCYYRRHLTVRLRRTSKGPLLIRCTVPGLTPNRAAILRTPSSVPGMGMMHPAAFHAVWAGGHRADLAAASCYVVSAPWHGKRRWQPLHGGNCSRRLPARRRGRSRRTRSNQTKPVGLAC